MDTRLRITWVIATLLGIPSATYVLWWVPPLYVVETPFWLDNLVNLVALPVLLIGALVLVAYTIRDLRRTKSIWAALFGFYMLGVGATTAVIAFAISYEESGLIQTVTIPPSVGTPCDAPQPKLTKMDYVYFSVITWTTVGYGDLVPAPKSRMIAATEAIFGHIYMAAYVSYLLAVIAFLSRLDFSFLEDRPSNGATIAKSNAPQVQATEPPKS